MASETRPMTSGEEQVMLLAIPEQGKSATVKIGPNQVVEIPFDLAEANISLAGNDLQIEFPGDAVLVLANFAVMVDQGVSPLLLLADGSVVAGDVLLTALTAELPAVAAGSGGNSGGAGEYRDDMGNLIDGVDRLGTQDADPFSRAVTQVVEDEEVAELPVAIAITPVNDAPTIAVVANDFTENSAAAGDVAGTYTTFDEDGDPLTVDFTPGTNTAGYYALGASGEVLLTETGAAWVNAGNDLPAIDLTVSDGALTGRDDDTPEVTPVNDAPVVGNVTATVSEEGLVGGNPDTFGNPADTTDSATFDDTAPSYGRIAISDEDLTDTLTVTLKDPTGTVNLTSGGDPVTWSLDATSKILTGSVNGTEIIVVTLLDDTGNYRVDLKGSIDHETGGAENLKSFDLSVQVFDGTATSSGILSITVEDDSPLLVGVAPATVVNDATGYTTGSSDLSIGADAPGSTDLTGNITGWNGATVTFGASPLTANGATVYYFVDPADTGMLYAYTSTTPGDYSGAVGQTLIFTLSYDHAGDYILDMNGKLDGPTQTFVSSYDKNLGGNQDYLLITDTGAIYKPGDTIPAAERVVMSVDSSIGTVNSSAQGLATDNQWIDGSEALYFTFTSPVYGAKFAIDIHGGNATNTVHWVAYGLDADGNAATESGDTLFSAGALTAIPTTLKEIARIELADTGGSGFRVSGSELTDRIEESPFQTSFQVTVVDEDGDQATATLSVQFDPLMAGKLIIGSNDDDIDGSSSLYTAPRAGAGEIAGAAGGDILVGDAGGSTLQPGATANFVLVLDTSTSMINQTISFGGEIITRLEALKLATVDALNSLAASGAQDIRVHIVRFGSIAGTVGTYDLTVNGTDDPDQLQAAIDAVSDMTLYGTQYTNYEAGLVLANQWIASANGPLAGADLNKLVFISDGEPNRALNNSGQVVDVSASVAMQHILGTYDVAGSTNDDKVSEVSLIETAGPGTAPAFTIEAIGISVGSNALNLLSQVEGTDGGADNVTSASQLSTALGHLTGATVINDAAGCDVIHGQDGSDLLFGDTLNTDALADSHGLTTPDGAGWLVFQQLEAGSSGWTRADTLDYIKNHHAELAAESGRSGGNDTIHAGAGDDLVYGQEGNDTLIGGSGDDLLTGGSGDDVFAYSAQGGEGHDTILDFNVGEDILRFHDVLDSDGNLDVDISDLLDPNHPQYVDFNKIDDTTIELTVHGTDPEPTTITVHAADGTDFTTITQLTDLNVQVDPNSHTI